MADGKLVLCLGQNNAIDLKKILRDTSYSRDAMKSIIVDAVKLKPAAHSLESAHGVQVIRFMSITGG
jgi:cyclic pyranopterin phosphate synthase